MQQLQHKLAALVSGTADDALERLQALLGSGTLTPDSSLDAVARLMQPTAIYPSLLWPVMATWRMVGATALPPAALALCLSTARQVRASLAAQTPQLDLVWTGPHAPPDAPARATEDVMAEMVATAKERILLVGYALEPGGPASRVVAALATARSRGCAVRVALHAGRDNHNTLRQLWPPRIPMPETVRWVGRPGDRIASLHAKLLVVDGHDILVTSANLSYHGLEQNIEVGVRIRGDFARQVDEHFTVLEREGILVPHGESGV